MAIAASFPNLRPSLLLDFANAKAVDPRITFTRSTTAKYYDGVTTAKAEENFLSNTDLSSGNWSTVGSVTKVGSTTDPAGGSTGVELNFTGSGFLFKSNTFPATQITVSVYAKEGTTNTLRFRIYNNTSTTTYTSSTFTLTADWERYDFTFTNGVAAPCNFQLDVGGTNTGTVYFAFPQAEARSQATAYTPTTTQPITNYIPVLQTAAAGVPRIDHDPVTGECLGLLIEEQRTNLLTYSEQFDNAAWNKGNVTVTANAVVAPDGTLTADKLVEDSTLNQHNLTRTISVSGGATTYTQVIYIKAAGRTWAGIFITHDFASTAYCAFNLATGVPNTPTTTGVSTASSSMIDVGNGWYRCALTIATAGFTNPYIIVQSLTGSSSSRQTYTGDGYSGIYIWGAQLEAGAFPTSYIPTVAAQETRSPDAASMTGTNFSSWYNAGEGTLYADYVKNVNVPSAAAFNIVFISEGTQSSRTGLQSRNASPVGETVEIGATRFALGSLVTSGATAKVAIALKGYDFAGSLNGAASVTNTTIGLPNTPNKLNIGSAFDNSVVGSFALRKISYYPQRLTNANLQALTA